jgi:DNA-directed RNA polymerase subunit N (RpoN/RPB10)
MKMVSCCLSCGKRMAWSRGDAFGRLCNAGLAPAEASAHLPLCGKCCTRRLVTVRAEARRAARLALGGLSGDPSGHPVPGRPDQISGESLDFSG